MHIKDVPVIYGHSVGRPTLIYGQFSECKFQEPRLQVNFTSQLKMHFQACFTVVNFHDCNTLECGTSSCPSSAVSCGSLSASSFCSESESSLSVN